MTERKSLHNQTTVPVLDRHGQPLAPARPIPDTSWTYRRATSTTDACLDLPTEVGNLTGPVTLLRRQRRHNRQSINCNASGTPYSKDFPAYSRLPRSQQGYTTPPAHSTAPRRLKSIGSGDMIRIVHRTGQTFTGRATLSLRDKRIKIKGMGKSRQTVSAPTSQPG